MEMDLLNQANKLLVHRIIPFSNVEGSGNRCSIFLQGCNINCLYCHNRETISLNSNMARWYSIEELLDIIKKSMPFIRGITISGGEPTLQYQSLITLFKEVHKLGLTCYIDTNGYFVFDEIEDLIAITDQFLFDIKGYGIGLNQLCFSNLLKNTQNSGTILMKDIIQSDEQIHVEDEMFNGKHAFANLSKLLVLDKIEEIRLVYIKNYYDIKEVISLISQQIVQHENVVFKIIRVHLKGTKSAYKTVIQSSVPSEIETLSLKDYAISLGIKYVVIIQ